jgi:hypothetical protein
MLDRLMPLHKAIFHEPGVAGTKYCLAKMGLIRNVVRSPLTTGRTATAALLDSALAQAGVRPDHGTQEARQIPARKGRRREPQGSLQLRDRRHDSKRVWCWSEPK